MKRWIITVGFFLFAMLPTRAYASCRSISAGQNCVPNAEMTCINPTTNQTVGCCTLELGPDECSDTFYPPTGTSQCSIVGLGTNCTKTFCKPTNIANGIANLGASFCCNSPSDCPAGTAAYQAPNTVCDYAGTKKDACNGCVGDGGAYTAIGCIPTSPSGFIGKLLQFGIGIGGGIAFLLILFGGFQMMTSSGNPEKLNEGKELVGSAIAGLLMIIFSIFLLRLIGFTILGIPGFG